MLFMNPADSHQTAVSDRSLIAPVCMHHLVSRINCRCYRARYRPVTQDVQQQHQLPDSLCHRHPIHY